MVAVSGIVRNAGNRYFSGLRGFNQIRLRAVIRFAFVGTLSSLMLALELLSLTAFWVRWDHLMVYFDRDPVSLQLSDMDPNRTPGRHMDTVSCVLSGGPVERAGIRVGDTFAPQMGLLDRVRMQMPVRREGERFTVTMLRHGEPHRFTIVATGAMVAYVGKPIDMQSGVHALRGFVYFLFVVIGSFLVLARASPVTWSFYLFCVGTTLTPREVTYYLVNMPMPLGFVLNLFRVTLFFIGMYAFVSFALRFPKGHIAGWRRTAERALLIFYGVYFAITIWAWFTTGYSLDAVIQSASHIFGTAIASFLADASMVLLGKYGALSIFVVAQTVAIVSLLGTYRAAARSERQRLVAAIVGILGGFTAMYAQHLLWLVPYIRTISPDSMALESLQAAAVIGPLALGYAVLKHRLIDIRFIVSHGLVFASIGAVLIGVFFGIDWLFAVFFANSRLQIVAAFAAVAAMSLLLQSGHARLVAVADRIFFPRHRQRMDRLRELRDAVEADDDPASVQWLITARACDALGLSSSAFFLRADDGGFVRENAVGWELGTAWHLLADDAIVQRSTVGRSLRIDDLAWKDVKVPPGAARPTIVISVKNRRKTVALQFYGAHTTGLDVDPEELRGLVALCTAAAPVLGTAPR
jgi:hypothetical protein